MSKLKHNFEWVHDYPNTPEILWHAICDKCGHITSSYPINKLQKHINKLNKIGCIPINRHDELQSKNDFEFDLLEEEN